MRLFAPLIRHQAIGLALTLLWAWWLSCTSAYATVVIDSPHFHQSILPQISYFEDNDNVFEPDSFNDPVLLQQFTPARTPILRFGFTRSTVWLRLQIDNRQNEARNALLYVTRPNIGLMRVYRFTADGLQPVGEAGSMTDHIFDRAEHRAPLLSLPLPAPGQYDFLVQMRSDHYLNFSLQLATPSAFYQEQYQHQTLVGIGAGIILVMVIQALAGFLRRRDINAFAYAVYGLAILFHLGATMGYIGYLWLPIPNLQIRLDALALLLLCGTNIQFCRTLLATRHSRRLLDAALKALLVIITLGLLATLLLPSPMIMQCAMAIALLAIPMMLYTVIVRAMDGCVPAYYLIPSRVLILLVGGLSAQSLYAQLALGMETTWLMLLVLFADAILARMALNHYQKGVAIEDEQQRQQLAIVEAERRAKTDFLAQISHEIRTPMNGILGMAELLEDSPLTPSQEDFVQTITASGNHLLKILDDILDYSKIETGKMALDITSFDIGLMLSECVEMFKARAREKNLELVTHIQADVPFQVKGDPTRIRQVLANLISNAIKFTDHGEVVIEIARDATQSDRHIRFTVTDTGVGMNREQLQTLFTRREQLDHLQHHGLGLSISQQLVQMMHGDMGAESQLNRGSTFWFCIPLEPDSEGQDTPLVAEQLQGLRLLVVDDNASCRLVLQQQASAWGMQVSAAMNGKQALAMLHNQATIHEPFDIVILDHEMPGMTGMELAARIKEDPLISNDPLVLMLTGLGMAPSTTAARNAGIRRVITKPVTGRLLKLTLLEELAHLRRIQASHSRDENGEETLPSMNILVAEDHHLSQKVIKGMLARLGMRAWTVDNGQRALELVKQQPFDLVLMDCEMPVMNGFDTAIAIREWEKAEGRESLPIIALTAHIMDEHRDRSLQCGMNAHLSKPIELSELRDTLLRWSRPSAESRSPSRKVVN